MEPVETVCGQKMTAKQVDLYYELLNDIPEPVLAAAALRWMQESEQTFLPAIGTIRRLASEVVVAAMPSWGVEWERVNLAIRKFGHNQKQKAIAFLGPFTAAVVCNIGWDTICQSETIGVQMSQFRNLYELAVQAETTTRRISEELRPIVTGERVSIAVEQSKRLAVNK